MSNIPKENIDNIVYDILKRSKSLDIFPTPVDKIVQYCELLDKDTFHSIPKNYFSKKKDALERALKKVIGVLDRKQKIIYIDPELPNIKKSFVKLHEVGHHSLPWQTAVSYEDTEFTLSSDVKEIFEAEANYFASSSLFQLDRFEEEMSKLPLEILSPMALAKKFGGSNHAAIRRYAECSTKKCALLVLEKISGSQQTLKLRNSFQSPSFTKEFGELTWPETFDKNFPFVLEYMRGQRLHKDGSITLGTMGGFVEFIYHYFYNQYNVFVLIIPIGEKIKSRTKIILTSASQ